MSGEIGPCSRAPRAMDGNLRARGTSGRRRLLLREDPVTSPAILPKQPKRYLGILPPAAQRLRLQSAERRRRRRRGR
ncbi:hypothetical protein TESG_02108 [Trichophyton tonsurans CBS 112818]|uniref:Uncharacterized protein n=1 Tax=Trichophyton tonsurans (strain CBS 112818) TaxID=647933 RepID=F2RTF0_TRIT1|nr:hypothetical protein TESG_02108 [Trichophyton tonsurans CBS 112818]